MTAEGILIVEDDGILAASLEDTLSDMGYRILAAVATGEDAVALAEKSRPQLILMDIELAGELSGIQAAETIRTFSDIPIVFLTGYSQEPLIRQAKFTAPAGYLIKPVPAPELQATIEMALYRHVLDRQVKESETRTKSLLETLDVIFNTTPVIMMLIDRDLRITAINRAGCDFTGLEKDTVIGIPCGEAMRCPSSEQSVGCGQTEHCRECPLRSLVMQTYSTGKPIFEAEGRLTVQRNNSSVALDFLFSTALVTIEKDALVLLTATDITERRKVEQNRLELERRTQNLRRLESLSTVAAGVAHDFNNILTAVYGNMHMALAKLPPDSPSRMFVEEALQSSERALLLSGQMLAFTGQSFSRREIVDVNEIVRSAGHEIQASAPAPISVSMKLHPFPLHVSADPDEMRQVVLNLVTNAAESMTGTHSSLTVTTGMMECTASYLAQSRITEKPAQGRYAYLDVIDTGCGMDEETVARLFEPFFSTKFLGRGLGMPVVYGIIKGHGGAILLDSTPHRGTMVRILLPLAQ